MNRRWRSWVCIALVVATSCSLAPPAEDATGEEIYGQLCARCHDDDLSGQGVAPPLGPGSDAASESDEFLEHTIMNGRGRMPSFRLVLSDVQLGRLIDYLREVQAG